MDYYKDSKGNVYSYSKGIPSKEGLTKLTEEELKKHLFPELTSQQLSEVRRARISEELKENDEKSIRPLRAVLDALQKDKNPDPYDLRELAELEQIAVDLRREYQELNNFVVGT